MNSEKRHELAFDISVAICTYNRADSLARTLDSLMKLTNIESLKWELLLIDNNCSDHTKDVTMQFQKKLPIRYIFEENQGLSRARNRAIRECQSDFLLFTDDDVILTSKWLSRYDEARRHWLDTGFFGGRIKPLWENNNRPAWLVDDNMPLIGGLLVHYDLGDSDRPYEAKDPVPFGASFAIRRSVFEVLDEFCSDLGPIGKIPGRGDDAEYLERTRERGFSGTYVGSALCYHTVDLERLKLGYLYRFGIQKGLAAVQLGQVNSSLQSTRLKQLDYAIRGLVQLLKGKGDRFRQCVINMGIQEGIYQARK